MKKICVHCNKEFDEATKKCSECGKRLKVVLTKEEQEELKKQNDDMVLEPSGNNQYELN